MNYANMTFQLLALAASALATANIIRSFYEKLDDLKIDKGEKHIIVRELLLLRSRRWPKWPVHSRMAGLNILVLMTLWLLFFSLIFGVFTAVAIWKSGGQLNAEYSGRFGSDSDFIEYTIRVGGVVSLTAVLSA